MKPRRWFLPETPDVLGLLRHQLEVTIESVDAFAAWANGDAGRRRPCATPGRGGQAKRELLSALRAAFVTPLEPEDVFALSRGVDRIQRHTRDLVTNRRPWTVSRMPGSRRWRTLPRPAAHRRRDRQSRLGRNEATASADAAIAAERQLERVYHEGMAALLEVGDRHERIARRELYRRCSRIGETVVEVAERVVYAVVKQT